MFARIAMTKLKWMLIILLIFLIPTEFYAISEASATGTDDWPTFHHDPNHSGYTTVSGSTNSMKLSWNFTTTVTHFFFSRSIHGYLFVGSDDYPFTALTPQTANAMVLPTADVVDSSPSIYNGNVYVGSDDGNLYCLTLITGRQFGFR